MTCKEYAALMAPVLFARVLEDETCLWTCRHCGVTTTILSEVCAGCGVEDCEQGEKPQ